MLANRRGEGVTVLLNDNLKFKDNLQYFLSKLPGFCLL